VSDILDAVFFDDSNPEPRCPCVLLLDTSSSMQGASINALNTGLRAFQQAIREDEVTSMRIEIAIVTFNSEVSVVQHFVTADDFNPPTLTTTGSTCMGAGIEKALNLVAERKATYRANGTPHYRPWIFMITDGEATDSVDEARRRIAMEQAGKHSVFFPVGVTNANMAKLRELSSAPEPVKLEGLNFREMFLWLSSSLKALSGSRVGEQVALSPVGWGKV